MPGTIYIARKISLGYRRQCRDFHGVGSLRYRATRRLDLEYGCGKSATSFYGSLRFGVKRLLDLCIANNIRYLTHFVIAFKILNKQMYKVGY